MLSDADVDVPLRARRARRLSYSLTYWYSLFALLFFMGLFSQIFSPVLDAARTAPSDSSGGTGYAVIASLLQLLAGLGLILRPLNARITYPVFLVVLMVFAMASVLWSIDRADTIFRTIALVGTTVVGLFIANSHSYRDILRLFVTTCAILCFASFVEVLIVPELGVQAGGSYLGSWRGVFVYKNALGWASAIGLVFTYAAYRAKILPNFLAIGLALLELLTLIRSNSITSVLACFLGFAAVAFVRAFVRYPRLRWVLGAAAVIVLLLVIGLVIVFGDADADPGAGVFNAVGRSATLSGRTRIWAAVILALTNRPLTGFGFGAFWGSPLCFHYMATVFYAGNSQNGYLDLCLDLGVIGLAIFLVVALLSAKGLLRAAVNGDWAATALVATQGAILLTAVAAPVLVKQNSGYWVFLVIMSACAVRMSRKQKSPAAVRRAAISPVASPLMSN